MDPTLGRRVAAQRAAERALQTEIDRAVSLALDGVRRRLREIPEEERRSVLVDGQEVVMVPLSAVEALLDAQAAAEGASLRS